MTIKCIGKYLKRHLPRFNEYPYKDIEEIDVYLIPGEEFKDRIVINEEITPGEFILYVGENVLIKMRNQKINEILK